jgi:hypothetical protein
MATQMKTRDFGQPLAIGGTAEVYAWGSYLTPLNRRPRWLIFLLALTALMAICSLNRP